MSRVCVVVLTLLSAAVANAAEPRVKELRQQRIGDVTYFRVVLADLSGLAVPDLAPSFFQTLPDFRRLIRGGLPELPRLIPQDDRTAAVAYDLPYPQHRGSTRELVFLGKATREGEAHLLLLYPVEKKEEKPLPERLLPSLDHVAWVEKTVTLTLRQPAPSPRVERRRAAAPKDDDLEGQWAEAQARQFAVEEALSDEFGYPTLAREMLGRKYNVPAQPLGVRPGTVSLQDETARLYEMTTGASALAETLATRRLLGGAPSATAPRVDDVSTLPGIDIAEHPWRKMMGDRKPATERLAELIPHDHYYIAFNSIRKFLDFGELLEQWGSPLQQGFELQARDYELKRRYERQLCLRSTSLGRTLGPALIRGVAVTGSDLYVREGTDVSVLFQVRNSDLFFAAVEPFLVEARKEFGKELKEAREKYRDIPIESFVTPLREVSLHRAALSDVVVYANSGIALRRILDTQLRRRPALSDMLDFQYMRTVFRADDKDEDGFAYLSDAFIRQQVGPASKIKEKRRLEALASLQTMTHAALFHAWHAGQLPRDATQLVSAAGLQRHETPVPEGNSPTWDAARRAVVSDAYNTIHFLTPLLELPIDKVTVEERKEYERFRAGYLSNWRQFFDPVGFRFQLRENQSRIEMYLLPLVENSDYNALRRQTGQEAIRFDAATIGQRALFQYTTGFESASLGLGLDAAVGDRLFWRLDDGPGYHHWLQLLVARDRGLITNDPSGATSVLVMLSGSPVLGVRIKDEKEFDNLINFIPLIFSSFKLATRPQETLDHRGVKIRLWRIDPADPIVKRLNPAGTPASRRVEPGVCWMKLDGYFYLATNQDSLKRIVEDVQRAKTAQQPSKEDIVSFNSGVYLSEKGALQSGPVLRALLEWETHKRVAAAEPLWTALHRAGIADDSPRFLGFVPTSPDGSRWRYDARRAEVSNERHGNRRQPRLHDSLASTSPLTALLEQLQWLRAELRFREDGIHTTVTLRRAPAK